MCITAKSAKLRGTTILGNILENGNHVLSYQFEVENTSGQPNCLILPIPGDIVKLHNTATYPSYLLNIWNAVEGAESGGSKGLRSFGGSQSVTVERVGQYLVLYGKDIQDIKSTIKEQAKEYRVEIGDDLSNFYQKHYSGENILVCLFKSDAKMGTQPFMVEYTPYNPEYFRFPMMDAHDGSAPKQETVDRDHIIMLGIENDKDVDGTEATIRIPQAPTFISASKYIGAKFDENTENGDLFLRVAKNHEINGKVFNEIQMAWTFGEALEAMQPLT